MAVPLQRTHAEFVGEGEGLAVVGFGLRSLWGIAPCRNVAKEAQGMGLVAPLLALTSERQRALGEGVCLLQVARQHLCLPQEETTEHLLKD